jgi:predicted transcriptional regulator YheO
MAIKTISYAVSDRSIEGPSTSLALRILTAAGWTHADIQHVFNLSDDSMRSTSFFADLADLAILATQEKD